MSTDIEAGATLSEADTAALRGIVAQVEEIWAANDADRFAELFTEDATLIIPGDVYLTGKEHIRGYFKMGYAGPMKGSTVSGKPIAVRAIGPGTAIVITSGGVIYPGQETVTAENQIRATWVAVRRGTGWAVTAYHNSRLQAPPS